MQRTPEVRSPRESNADQHTAELVRLRLLLRRVSAKVFQTELGAFLPLELDLDGVVGMPQIHNLGNCF